MFAAGCGAALSLPCFLFPGLWPAAFSQLHARPGFAVWGDRLVRGFDGSLSNYRGEVGEQLDVRWEGGNHQGGLGGCCVVALKHRQAPYRQAVQWLQWKLWGWQRVTAGAGPLSPILLQILTAITDPEKFSLTGNLIKEPSKVGQQLRPGGAAEKWAGCIHQSGGAVRYCGEYAGGLRDMVRSVAGL